MIDIKSFSKQAIKTMTSPTAFSWYAVAGVIATGVVTFLATCKWKDRKRDKIFEEGEDKHTTVKDVVETALIFTPPVLTAGVTCYCIKHGNNMSMETIGTLTEANNFLSGKLTRSASAAAGLAVGKMNNQSEDREVTCLDANLLSGDPAEIDDHGRVVLFHDTFCDRWFESTIFDVVRAEEEVHKFFSLRGYVSVAEFQAFLHLPISDEYGWTQLCGWDDNVGYKRGYLWVEFTHDRKILDDGRVYYTINYVIPPVFDEEFEWIMQDEDEWVMDEGDEYWVRS